MHPVGADPCSQFRIAANEQDEAVAAGDGRQTPRRLDPVGPAEMAVYDCRSWWEPARDRGGIGRSMGVGEEPENRELGRLLVEPARGGG